jgi:hypothetical protein
MVSASRKSRQGLEELTCEPLLPKVKSRKRHAVALPCASYMPTTTGFTVCAVRTDKLPRVSQLVNAGRGDRHGEAETDRPTSNSLRSFAIFVPLHSGNPWCHRSVTGAIVDLPEPNSWPNPKDRAAARFNNTCNHLCARHQS